MLHFPHSTLPHHGNESKARRHHTNKERKAAAGACVITPHNLTLSLTSISAQRNLTLRTIALPLALSTQQAQHRSLAPHTLHTIAHS